ncbi:MAG: hypothetical protein J6Q53_05270 [Oscillospiraceae bacterium]|nr:hypothetical protein [Oscillospiraceae bacterium]
MQKNSENFSMQDALRLAKSPAGQRLLALLQQTEGSTLQQAMDQADAGDYDSVKKTLASLMENEEVKALMNQLGG